MASTFAIASLTNATAISDGLMLDLGRAGLSLTMFVKVNGTVTGGGVELQASHNGIDFVPIARTGTIQTATNERIFTVEPWRYMRASIFDTIVGGGSVTCTLMNSAGA